MESAPSPLGEKIKLKINHVIYTKVCEVEEEFQPCYISGIGKDAIFENRSKGWFVYLEGSYEALLVGKEKPDLQKGDRIKITLEKVDG